MENETLTDKELYEKMIADSEKEIRIIQIRTNFWQRQDIMRKFPKEMIMEMARQQQAQLQLQTEWVAFLKEKRPKK